MKDSVAATDYGLTITISDKLTFEDHNEFRDLLRLFDNKDHKHCRFDLQGLKTIDSAGLGMLMIAFETAEKAGIQFQLYKPDGQVKQLLEISEFDKVMNIVH
ncbi:MAG: STAS domain-containing protein [Sneathiella sp.]|nr:STAS domain-containing protein [Sneathiella sp.]